MRGTAGGDGRTVPVVAAVDIGSNSIKLTVGRPGAEGRPEELRRSSRTVRLGRGVAETGRLAQDRVEEAVAVLSAFAAEARGLGASRLVGVATEATRAATNGPAFLDRVRRETGLEIGSITGDQEANLVFRGLAATADLSGPVVAADIGGGSTEVLVVEDGRLCFERSLRLGSGTLTDRHVATDPPTATEIAACLMDATAVLADPELPQPAGARLIVIGGTGRYLAQLVGSGRAFDRASTNAVLDDLARRPAAKVASRLAILPVRAQVLPAGVAIVRALIDRFAPVRVEAARSTVRVGLLMATFEAMAATGTAVPAGDRGREVSAPLV